MKAADEALGPAGLADVTASRPTSAPLDHPSLTAAATTAGLGSDASAPSPPSTLDEWAPPRLIDACTSALRHLGGPNLGSIGVTSCLRREGRTTIAKGIALANRHVFGQATILVEFDLERPTLAEQLGLRRRPGMAEILRDGASLEECVQHHQSGLDVLVAGETGDDPRAVLASLRDTGLVAYIGVPGQTMVADLPPLSPVGQGTLVADLFSTVLLVVRAGATPAALVRRAVDGLNSRPAVMLNGIESSLPRPLRALFGG